MATVSIIVYTHKRRQNIATIGILNKGIQKELMQDRESSLKQNVVFPLDTLHYLLSLFISRIHITLPLIFFPLYFFHLGMYLSLYFSYFFSFPLIYFLLIIEQHYIHYEMGGYYFLNWRRAKRWWRRREKLKDWFEKILDERGTAISSSDIAHVLTLHIQVFIFL